MTKIIISHVKFRGFNAQKKPDKLRLKEADLRCFNSVLENSKVKIHFEKNILTITSSVNNTIIETDGINSGGQILRTWIGWAIKQSGGRTCSPKDFIYLENESKKACMLGVQIYTHTLKQNESINIIGGDPFNKQAPYIESHYQILYYIYKTLFGIDYILENNSSEKISKFKLSRNKDILPLKNWNQTNILNDTLLSTHLLDQILMGFVFHKSNDTITLSAIYDGEKEYHVPSMCRLLNEIGVKIIRTIEKDIQIITIIP